MTPRRGRRDAETGGSLLGALLALLVLSALSASALLMALLERRTAENHAASVRAFYLAESGLNEHLSRLDTAPLPRSTTATYSYGGGIAAVTSLRLLSVDARRELHHVSATGSYRQDPEGTSHRETATLVLSALPQRPTAALSAAEATELGSNVILSGRDVSRDRCGDPSLPLAGLQLPIGLWSGDTTGLDGTPPLRETADADGLLRALDIDWSALIAMRASTGSGSAPQAPASVGRDSVRVLSDPAVLATPFQGRGILAAIGDLDITSDIGWQGLILVGGALRVDGRLSVRGAAVVGLNATLGGSPSTTRLLGPTTVEYDSCQVEAAARLLRSPLAEVPGTWRENIEF